MQQQPPQDQPAPAVRVINQRRLSTDVMIGVLAANAITVVVLVLLGAISV